MALFQLRKPRKEQAAPPLPTQTVEAVRRRALHRLIGAAVLVVAGVIGFPLIFDSQPRPIPVDLPIEIADKDKVAPLQLPPSSSPALVSGTSRTDAAPSAASPSTSTQAPAAVEVVEPPVVAAAPPSATAPVARAEVQTPPVAAVPRTAEMTDAQKARALLEGRTASPASASASAAATDARFVVQVGAFAEDQKMREVRMKVERAGFKTYTQVVTTKDGPRTRVRVGPFDDRSKAQQAADKIRQLDLAPSILTL